MTEENQDKLRSLAEIDRVIHEPARLLVMMYLAEVDWADFVFLHTASGLTWGNLSAHLAKLEEAGYIEVNKQFIQRKPHTMLRLSQKGRQALQVYRQTMKQALEKLKDTSS
jgi:DNA-binding transcriptional ArsR family regulator